MTYDKEVDVFPTVRYVHSVRPQAVTLEVSTLYISYIYIYTPKYPPHTHAYAYT